MYSIFYGSFMKVDQDYQYYLDTDSISNYPNDSARQLVAHKFEDIRFIVGSKPL
jgi:hypothetical protein